MLNIDNLHAQVDNKDILKGLTLTVNPGEVHAIMGPNGSGKSTLGHVLAGRPGYEVTEGSVIFQGKDLLDLDTEERAHLGIFLAFQYPVEIPGVSNMEFLKAAVDATRESRGLEALDTVIIGVSKDSCASHRQFINKFDLKIQLLADSEGTVCRDYGVWQEKEKNGVKKMGIVRSTFIIDKSGTLVDVEYGVVPDGHAQTVLDKIRVL